MSTIEVKSVGPISDIAFDLPVGTGGVKLFKGTSGAGKTTAICALNGLLGDKASAAYLTPTDGELSGEVKGLGRTLRVGKKNTTTGSAKVPHLVGRASVEILVEPKVGDTDARHRARVKYLVSIGGKKLTPVDLLMDDYERYSSEVDLDDIANSDDSIAMAEKLKRSLDSLALSKEREAERMSGMSTAKLQEAGDIDELTEAESYDEALERSRKASAALQNAKLTAQKAESIATNNANVLAKITELQAADPDDLETLRNEVKVTADTIASLQRRLEQAKELHREASSKLEMAEARSTMLSKLQTQVADEIDAPSAEEILKLELAEKEAIERMNLVASLGRRIGALEDATKHRDLSVAISEEAVSIRALAHEVVRRAQQALPEGPIQLKDGELVIAHRRRGKDIPFESLSTGEKWRVAMKYAIATVGAGGIIPMSQEAWQSLGPELKDEIAEIARESEVFVISASVEEGGELRVEDFPS